MTLIAREARARVVVSCIILACLGAASVASCGEVLSDDAGTGGSSSTHVTTDATGPGGSSPASDAGDAGATSDGDAGTCAPTIGAANLCTASAQTCCVAQGGVPGDICTSPLGCNGGGQWPAVCYPPLPAPAANQFACDYFNCDVGQVCTVPIVVGDGCWTHACKAPPAPCDATPTCACLSANGLLAGEGPTATCTEDAAGNARVTGDVDW